MAMGLGVLVVKLEFVMQRLRRHAMTVLNSSFMQGINAIAVSATPLKATSLQQPLKCTRCFDLTQIFQFYGASSHND